jgi:membrane protein required for beta-lactamase induction
MAEVWLGLLLILGIDFVLLGLVGVIILVTCTRLGRWQDRRQARRFAEAVARSEFNRAETVARRAFQLVGKTDLIG